MTKKQSVTLADSYMSLKITEGIPGHGHATGWIT
jgi:hypothetical protein